MIPRDPKRAVLLQDSPIRLGELESTAGAIATWLGDHHAAGDAICVASASDRVVLEVLLGALDAGTPVLVLDPATGAAAAHQALASIDAKAIIVDADRATAWSMEDGPWSVWPIKRARASLVGRLLGRRSADPTTWPAVLQGVDSRPLTLSHDAHAPAVFLRTSGTSGRAQLPILTRANLDAQVEATVEGLGFDADSVFLAPSPASHIDGILALYMAWRAAVPVVRPGAITVAGVPAVLGAIYRHRVTHAMLVPSFLRLAIRLGQDLREALDTPDFQHLICTAEPLPEALWATLEQQTGKPVSNVYGMTEVGNILFAGPGEGRERGTVGLPRHCSLRIVDEQGCDVADGEPGELWVSGPTISPGYVGEPPHGEWFATGDLAERTPTGTLRIVGRRSSLLKVAGHRVVPEHVDATLQQHPSVLEAVSVGLPDETWGTRLVSMVVTTDDIRGEDLRTWLAERLADVEVPREVVVTDALPRGRTGKVSSREVVALLSQSGTQEGPDVTAAVLHLAARIFRASPEELSPATSAERFDGWDSIAHLDFVVALEAQFSMSLTPAQILGIHTLADAIRLVEDR